MPEGYTRGKPQPLCPVVWRDLVATVSDSTVNKMDYSCDLAGLFLCPCGCQCAMFFGIPTYDHPLISLPGD